MGLSDAYKSWRHTRGYGVHSPFAYMLVKEAIRPSRRYAWYAYDDIELLLPAGASRLRREARMFFRLLATLRPATICFHGNIHAAFRCAALCANRRMGISIYRGGNQQLPDADVLASAGESIPGDILCRFISSPSKILLVKEATEELRLRILDAMPSGVMFYGRRNLICVSRPEMQKVTYSVRI